MKNNSVYVYITLVNIPSSCYWGFLLYTDTPGVSQHIKCFDILLSEKAWNGTKIILNPKMFWGHIQAITIFMNFKKSPKQYTTQQWRLVMTKTLKIIYINYIKWWEHFQVEIIQVSGVLICFNPVDIQVVCEVSDSYLDYVTFARHFNI